MGRSPAKANGSVSPSPTKARNEEFALVMREISALAVKITPSAAPRNIQLTRSIVALQAAVAAGMADSKVWLRGTSADAAWHTSEPVVAALRVVADRSLHEHPAIAVRAGAVLDAALPGTEEIKRFRATAKKRVAQVEGTGWRRNARKRPDTTGVAKELDALIARGPDMSGLDVVERRAGREAWLRDAAPHGVAPVAGQVLRSAYFGEETADRRFMAELRSAVAEGFVHGAPLSDFVPLLDTVRTELGPDRKHSSAGLSGEIETINISGLREYFAGKSVCLVANSADLLEHQFGAEIDSYDIVVRFNSFAIDAPHTGSRTDVHATIHRHDFNWNVPVDVRLVFSGSREWSKSVARYLHPEAQRFLGDESVRWPRNTLLDEEVRRRIQIPTTGMNTIAVLDYLNVSTKIDLFGFNFHSGRPYRRDDAMHLPVAGVHSYKVERDWVMERAVSTAPSKISLR